MRTDVFEGEHKPAPKLPSMPRKKQEPSEFGSRLAELRKQKGLTQVELAKAIGSTQRAISYYESFHGYPPVTAVASLAQALDVSTDELLGLERKSNKSVSDIADPEARKLWKKVKRVLELPPSDQKELIRVITKMIDGYEVHSSRKSA
jgi:transcriptional regulator with XRE-family HTH domain